MLSPIQAYILFFKRLLSFQGRSSRAELWWVMIFELILFLIAGQLIEYFLPDPRTHQFMYSTDEAFTEALKLHAIVNQVVLLLISLFFLSLYVRRLHDIGLSGWWMFMVAIPFIGAGVFFVAMLFPSQHKTNKYGEDPTLNPLKHFEFYSHKQN